MKIEFLHEWPATAADAVALQERLRGEVRLQPITAQISLVAAADVAYSPASRRLYAAATVVSLPSLEVIEVAVAQRDESFPYVPGLFAFRELPALLDALTELKGEPDVLMFDGHGLAHPRRFGLASHAGLFVRIPTIGCAKCVLTGKFQAPGNTRGDRTPLVADGEVVGTALRTRPGVMPLFISPGHLSDVESSASVALAATGRFRIPEPLRQAHMAAVAARRRGEEANR